MNDLGMRNSRGLRLSAERSVSMRAFAVYLWLDPRIERVEIGKISVGTNVVLEMVDEGAFNQPLCYIPDEAAQQLMDDLWNAGVRPANVRSMSETIEAKDAHIKDLQRVAFQMLDEAAESVGMIREQAKEAVVHKHTLTWGDVMPVLRRMGYETERDSE